MSETNEATKPNIEWRQIEDSDFKKIFQKTFEDTVFQTASAAETYTDLIKLRPQKADEYQERIKENDEETRKRAIKLKIALDNVAQGKAIPLRVHGGGVIIDLASIPLN